MDDMMPVQIDAPSHTRVHADAHDPCCQCHAMHVSSGALSLHLFFFYLNLHLFS